MKIGYSKSGTPFIDLDGKGILIFSKSTMDAERGYKYLCYSGIKTESRVISGARAKKKRVLKTQETVAFTVNMEMRRDERRGFPRGIVSNISLKWLKRQLSTLIDDGGYLHVDKVPVLGQIMADIDKDDHVDNDPTANESFDDVETVEQPKAKVKPAKKIKPKLKIKSVIKRKK